MKPRVYQTLQKPFLLLLATIPAWLYGQSVDWHIHLGATYIDQIDDHEIAENGDVYVLGRFADKMDFDPGSGETIIEHKRNASNNIFAGFIAKYSASAELIWVKYIGDEMGTLFPRQLEIDEENDALYIAGYFSHQMDFDPGPEEALLVATQGSILGDAFLASYNLKGDYAWAKNIARGSGAKERVSLELNSDKLLLVHQDVVGRADIDPHPTEKVWIEDLATEGVTSQQYIAAYSTNGLLEWHETFKATKAHNAGTMFLDENDNIYLAGNFTGTSRSDGTIDLNPDENEEQLATTQEKFKWNDGFVAKYDKDFNYLWHKTVHTALTVLPRSIAISKEGDVYLAGSFSSEAGFDFSPTGTVLQAGDQVDGFLMKFNGNTGDEMDKRNIAVGNFDEENSHRARVDKMVVDKDDNLYLLGGFSGTRYFFYYLDDTREKYDGRYITSADGGSFGGTETQDMFLAKYNSKLNNMWVNKIGGDGFGHDNPTGTMTLTGDKLLVSGRFLSEVDFGIGKEEKVVTAVEREDAFLVQYDLSKEVDITNVGSVSNAENHLTAYPNPFTDRVILSIKDVPQMVQLQSITGQTIQRWKPTSNRMELETAHIPQGIYLLTAILENGSVIQEKVVRE